MVDLLSGVYCSRRHSRALEFFHEMTHETRNLMVVREKYEPLIWILRNYRFTGTDSTKCQKDFSTWKLTFLSALKTIGVMRPLSVATATHISTLLYLYNGQRQVRDQNGRSVDLNPNMGGLDDWTNDLGSSVPKVCPIQNHHNDNGTRNE